jgi:hypothetical protein
MAPEPESQVVSTSPALQYIRAQTGLYRAYSPDAQLSYSVAPEQHVQLLDGVRSLQISLTARLVMIASGCYFEGYSAGMPPCAGGEAGPDAAFKAVPNLSLLGLLNVRWMVVNFPLEVAGLKRVQQFNNVNIYENSQVLPRAFVAGTVEVAQDDNEILTRLAASNPRDTVFVTSTRPLQGKSADATISEYTPNQIVLDTEISAPGMLVVSDAWLEGWQATDNGLSVPVERVDTAFRGIRLTEAGSHHIVLTYDPPSVKSGLGITLAGLAVLLGWTLIRLVYQRAETA